MTLRQRFCGTTMMAPANLLVLVTAGLASAAAAQTVPPPAAAPVQTASAAADDTIIVTATRTALDRRTFGPGRAQWAGPSRPVWNL